MEERELLFKKYKSLVQYKKKTDKQLYAIIDAKLQAKDSTVDLKDIFTDPKDLKKGNMLVKRYLEQKEFDNIAELQNLKNIIWLEVELEKNQEVINKLHDKAEEYVPDDQLKSIINIMKQVSDLKKELGFYQKEKEESDGYKIVQRMMKRAEVWREKNQGTRTLICPHCQKMTLLKIRTDQYDAEKHPFFEDRILCNEHLMKLYAEKTITAEDVAKVLESSVDYVNPWLVERWKNNPKYEKIMEKITLREEKPFKKKKNKI